VSVRDPRRLEQKTFLAIRNKQRDRAVGVDIPSTSLYWQGIEQPGADPELALYMIRFPLSYEFMAIVRTLVALRSWDDYVCTLDWGRPVDRLVMLVSFILSAASDQAYKLSVGKRLETIVLTRTVGSSFTVQERRDRFPFKNEAYQA